MKNAAPGEHDTGLAAMWTGRGFYLAALLLLPIFLVLQLDVGFQVGDEGVALVGAWRLIQGQLPYRDYFEIIPPFSFVPTALVFKLFGAGMLQSRILSAFYAVLLVVLTDRLAARFIKGFLARAAIAAFLIPFGVFYWPMPSHHWVVDLLQLGAGLVLLAGLSRPSLGSGITAGILSALALLSLQDQGLIFLLALPVLFFPAMADRAGRLRVLAGWSAGVAGVGLIFLIYLVASGSLSEFWWQNFLFPLSGYRTLAGNRGGLLEGWEVVRASVTRAALAETPVYLLTFVVMTGILSVLPFAGVGALIAAYKGRWAGRAELGVVAALLAAFVGTCARRWALTNIVWAAPPLILMLAWGLDRAARSNGWIRRAGIWTLGTLTSVSLVFSVTYLVYCSPGKCGYVRAPAGTVRSYLRGEASSLQETVDAIETHVPKNSPLFCRGYLPLLNFLTFRKNPTRFTIFLYPEYNDQRALQEVSASLKNTPDAYVLVPLPMHGDALDWQILQSHQPVWKSPFVALFGPSEPAAPPVPEGRGGK